MTNELVFSVCGKEATQLRAASLEEIGFKERDDLQSWIEENPEIIGPDLLVLTTEFDRWEFARGGGRETVRDRLDVLLLDSEGSLVVSELKRGEAPDTVDLQALKYAAYCSQLTVEDVLGEYARYYEMDEETAYREVMEHAPSLEDGGLGPVKVRLIAESFRPSVTSFVLWLREYEVEIGCIQVSARLLAGGGAMVTSRQILPLPVAEDYLVRRRRREREEGSRESSGRRRNVPAQLLEKGAVEPGTELKLRLASLTSKQRETMQRVIEEKPEVGLAEWTGISVNEALRWRADGKTYSASGLVAAILNAHGHETRSVAGPRHWELPQGNTLSELAETLQEND